MDKSVCAGSSTMSHSPFSPPLLRPPCSLRHSNPEVRPFNNPATSSECSSERRSHKPFTLNQKLDTVKLSEESMSNADMGWENQPLVPACECRGKALEEGNEKRYSSEHINDKKAKQSQRWLEKVLVIWTEDQISHQHSLNHILFKSKALSLFSSAKAKRSEEAAEEKFEASRGWFLRFKGKKKLSP